jgi:hypothetical protein
LSRIAESNGTGNSERVSFDYFPADTYYIQVYGVGGDIAEYDLKIVSNGVGLPPDSDEPNDSQGQARWLAFNFSNTTLEYVGTSRDAYAHLIRATDYTARTNRTVHSTSDQDWYRVELLAWGRSGDYVAIDRFLNRQGDLQLELFDKSGNRLRDSLTGNDFETIPLEGLPPDGYYVHVFGYNRAVNWYRLSTSFVGIQQDDLDLIGHGDTREDSYFQAFVGEGTHVSDSSEPGSGWRRLREW